MSKQNCKTCKYDFDRHCQFNVANCMGCKMRDLERHICKCTEIKGYEECPYYEPMEEEVDE